MVIEYSLKDGLGEEIGATLSIYRIHDGKSFAIKNLELLASYNWAGGFKYPTIIVPGAPNIWAPKRLPMRVHQDIGMTYIDQNKARFPQSPLEPLIRALTMVNPEIDLSKFDIITDRSNLRKLIRWINAVNDPSDLKDFRIDAEVAGNTVLFTRWEKQTEECISDFRGFGLEFEKANTKTADGCGLSTGHNRIVAYNLGDLKLVVRFEVDACFAWTPDPKFKTEKLNEGEKTDDLVAALGGMKVSSDKPVLFDETGRSKLHYLKAGILVNQSEILELKTRSQRNKIDWNEVWPQLYLSQILKMVLAKHKQGQFVVIERNDLKSPPLSNIVDSSAGKIMSQLRNALELMKSLVLKYGKENGLAFVCESGKMRAFTRDVSTVPCTVVDSSLLKLFLPDRAKMEK